MLSKSSFDDTTLAKLAKDGDSEALTILNERHSGIFYNYANKYIHGTSGTLSNDLRENESYVFWRAADSYDETRGAKFASWLGRVVSYECSALIKKGKSKEISLEMITDDLAAPDYFATPEYVEEEMKKVENQEATDLLNDILDQIKNDNVRSAVEERYCHGEVKTYREAGKKLGISGQAVRNREKSFIKLAKNKMESKVVCDVV